MPTAAILQQMSRWDGVLPTPISVIMAGKAIESLLLKGTGSLADSILGSASESAVLKGTGALIDVLLGVGLETANLKGSGRLVDSILGVGSETALLKGSGKLLDSITGIGLETGSLKGAGRLIGSSTGHATETALLKALGQLIVSSLGVASETANLKASGKLAGSSTGSAIETALLKAVGTLLFSATGHGAETALLAGAGKILSSLQGTSSETAALKGSGHLIDVILGIASVTGSLNGGSGPISENILGQAIAVGILRGAGKFIDPVTGHSLFSGILHNASSGSQISASLFGSAVLFGELLGSIIVPPLVSFGVSLTNPATLDNGIFIQPTQTGIYPPIVSPDGWALPGQRLMPGKLLDAPGNGRLFGRPYTIHMSGTVTANNSPTVATINLNENYFSTSAILRSDSVASLVIPLQAGQTSSWSIVCRLSGNGLHNGTISGDSVLFINGVFAGGDKRESNFNPLESPTIQLSVGVKFSNGGQAKLMQFDLR